MKRVFKVTGYQYPSGIIDWRLQEMSQSQCYADKEIIVMGNAIAVTIIHPNSCNLQDETIFTYAFRVGAYIIMNEFNKQSRNNIWRDELGEVRL